MTAANEPKHPNAINVYELDEAGSVLVDQGQLEHPWYDGLGLTPSPRAHSSSVLKNTRMFPWSSVGPNSSVFESEILDYAHLVSDNQVFNAKIGKFCNIASGVRINPTNHPMWRATLHHFTYRSHSHRMGEDDPEVFAWRREHRVEIGHDVWIGHNAIVLPGVSVGTGAIIGAGSVVTKPVPDYTVVVGSPARIIRRRVEPHVEEALKRIAWWDWPHERLKAALNDFRRLDAGQFATKYNPAIAAPQTC